MKNRKTFLAAGAVLLAALVMAGVWLALRPQASAGAKDIVISVTYADGTRESFDVATDAEYLKEAADTVLTLEGEMGPYGFTLYAVNGQKADYTKDSAYWAIYVDGQYGQYGVDAQPVTDGSTYAFVYEKF